MHPPSGEGSPVAAFVQARHLEYGNAVLDDEVRRLEAIDKAEVPDVLLLQRFADLSDAKARATLGRTLADNGKLTMASLEGAAAGLDGAVAKAADDWHKVHAAIVAGRLELQEVRRVSGQAGQLASLLSLDQRWFWLSALVAAVAVAAALIHHHRQAVRGFLARGRWRRAAFAVIAALTLLLVAAAGAACLLGDRIYQAMLETPASQSLAVAVPEIPQTPAATLAALGQTRQELEKRRGALEAALERKVAQRLDSPELAARWKEARRQAVLIAQRAKVLDEVSRHLRDEAAVLAGLNAEIAALGPAARGHLSLRTWVRLGTGAALLTAVVVAGAGIGVSLKRRRRRAASICPMCLGRLRPDGSPPPAFGVVPCGNMLSKSLHIPCNYPVPEIARKLPKLCFPALGVPRAGKTHWLGMLYWEISRGRRALPVRFQSVPESPADAAEDFDAIVEQILTARMAPAATQRDRIPHPVVFQLADRDRWGASGVLVNVFDYSGEVTADMEAGDYRRKRALQADGYLYFLDPTSPAAPQAAALAAFCRDVQGVQGAARKRVGAFLALCLSKIDLLPGHVHGAAGPQVARFYEQLASIDPSGQRVSRSVIAARSRLTQGLCRAIWPDWDLAAAVGKPFGRRHCFFPLTPVGLDGCGESDLSLRTIAPFALAEPVLWLLEMNGYVVL